MTTLPPHHSFSLSNSKADKPCVPSVFFEGKTQDGDGFAGDCVEEFLYNFVAETPALVIIKIHNLLQEESSIIACHY